MSEFQTSMNKREASQYLGKTERAVERYTQAGDLSVKYKPGKTRPVADYDETELRELKHPLITLQRFARR